MKMKSNVLITGGLGYIGSHLYLSLIEKGHDVCIVDDLSNSHLNVAKHLEKFIKKRIKLYVGKVQDKELLKKIILDNKIDSVFHLAAYKSVEESSLFPAKYYENNINSTLALLDVLDETKCSKIIFSSSASVYGNQGSSPLKENNELNPLNVYAHTKIISEKIIKMYSTINQDLKYVSLRYFNPAGAHESGLIGEFSKEKPKNLFPVISMLANKNNAKLDIFGSDYNTRDGTPIRDYIHIMDLVEGHIKALDCLNKNNKNSKNITVNLGTGKGQTVLEVLSAYNRIFEKNLKFQFKDRRQGDSECCYADASLAYKILDWKTERSIDDIWNSVSNWNLKYPQGYDY